MKKTVRFLILVALAYPIEHTCDVVEGQQWISADGKVMQRFTKITEE